MLEFFRIEALLRSKTVIDLYRMTHKRSNKKKNQTNTLMDTYKVVGGWRVLDGVHHRFFLHQDHQELLEMRSQSEIDLEPWERWEAPGIANLGRIIEHDQSYFDYILETLKTPSKFGLKRKPRALWLAVDPARSPASLLRGMKSILQKEHQQYKITKGRIEDPFLEPPWPWPTNWEPYRDPRKPPPIYGVKGIKTWLDYIRCYDLRYNLPQGQTQPSFGMIAALVYGKNTRKTYERAEQGCKRVGQLIEAAEKNQWPPSIR